LQADVDTISAGDWLHARPVYRCGTRTQQIASHTPRQTHEVSRDSFVLLFYRAA
jgi:hypothetical protein